MCGRAAHNTVCNLGTVLHILGPIPIKGLHFWLFHVVQIQKTEKLFFLLSGGRHDVFMCGMWLSMQSPSCSMYRSTFAVGLQVRSCLHPRLL